MKNKNQLIDYAINWVNKLQHENDGFWYKGNPSIQQKINGAMKIITGLKATNRVTFNFCENLIDNCLLVKNDKQACDNFNITYVLKYCNTLCKEQFRHSEIEDFMYERLNIYKKFYHSKKNGFSFWRNKANRIYYGALLTKLSIP